MGRKSKKKKWIYVHLQLIHFAVQQKTNITLQSSYTPIKISKKNLTIITVISSFTGKMHAIGTFIPHLLLSPNFEVPVSSRLKNQCQMIDLSRIAPQPLPPGTAPPPVPKYHSIATQTYPDSNIPSIRHPFPWGWCAISAHLCVAMGPSTMSTHGRYLMNGESHPPAPRPRVCVCSVVSDSLQPCGILQARMLEWVAISFSRKEILIICLLSASWLPI